MHRWLAQVVAVAGVCLLTGWVASFTARPPAVDVAVWPPAGIALVAVLAYGRHVLPGVWLASFLLHVPDVPRYGPDLAPAAAAAGLAVIAAGAAAQAAFGAWLVRGLIGYPTGLVRVRDVLVFLVVAGPAQCVASATVGVSALCGFGVVPWATFPETWVGWWWSDVIGGVVFAPVALAAVGAPRDVWRPRVKTVAAPLVVAAGATAGLFLVARGWDEAEAGRRADAEADRAAAVLRADFDRLAAGLDHLRDQYPLPTGLDLPAQARGVVRSDLRTVHQVNPAVRAVTLELFVSADQRDGFETRVRRKGGPGRAEFAVHDLDPAGRPVPAPERSRYLVVAHRYPAGSVPGLGFDAGTDPARWAAADRAAATGEPVAARPADPARAGDLLVVVPVTDCPPRPAVARGVLVAVVDRAEWVAGLDRVGAGPLGFALTPPGAGPPAAPPGGRTAARRLDLGGDGWDLTVVAGPGYLAAHRTRYATGAGAVGVLLTAFLAALLLVVTGRTAVVAEEVAARTADLRAEAAARAATEARLAEAQRIARLGYWEWDPAGGWSWWSDEEYRIFGVDPAAGPPTYDRYLALVHPDDRAAVDRLRTSRDPVTAGYRIVRPDGQVRHIYEEARPAAGADGRPVVVGITQDVTDRARAEHALRESEERFRRVFEDSPIGIYRTTPGGRLVLANPAFLRMAGAGSVDELAGRDLNATGLHAGYPRAEFVRRMAEAGEVRGWEITCRRWDGAAVYLRENARAVRGPGGEVAYYEGTLEDATERKRAEDALRASEARLAEAQRIARVGSWESDPATGRSWWSDERYRLLGYAPAQVEPSYRAFLDRVHPDDRAAVEARVAAAVDHGEPYDFDHRVVLPTGEVRWLHATARVIRDPAGRAVRLEGTSQDVTDRKLAEEAKQRFEENLQQAQRLESLGVLAGGVAHDFNNLLTGVLGNAALAREQLPPHDDLHEYLRPIEKSAEHAAQLCQQMLAYAGKGGTVRGPVDLNRLIDEAADLVKLAATRRAALRVELAADVPPLVGDAGQLRQVLLNLVHNAAEALGPAGGAITVRTGGGPGDAPAGAVAWVEVADTGCGMDEATRARVFEPFYTTKFTGRGLGLSAVHGIVTGHGGAIRVDSEPGRGTTFRVTLPAAAARPAPLTVADAPPDPTTPMAVGRTALVADDEPAVRGLAAIALRSLGFTVVEAADGRQAAELVRADPGRFAVAVLDLVMPRADGRQALGEIRAVRADLPVVLMSGYSESDLADVRFGPALHFLQKPFRPADLTACVRRLVGATAGR